MKILDGRKLAEKIKRKIKKEVRKLKQPPLLAVILVAGNKISKIYIREKEKACQEVGIKIKKYFLNRNFAEKKLLKLIKKLNNDIKINGILIQLPLPKNYNTDKILGSVKPKKDVDGLGRKPLLIPPAAAAIREIFKNYKISLKGKKICLVGYGRLVGKPLAKILRKEKIKLTICTSKTKNLIQKTKQADILISATGVPCLITAEMVKKDAVVIDAGNSVEKIKNLKFKIKNYRVIGDIDYQNIKNIVSYITPPKGGIGPLTVAKLLTNVVRLSVKN